MSGHETASAGVEVLTSSEVFNLMGRIDPQKSPAYNAFEQIKGPELAGLFLQGHAENTQDLFPEDFSIDGSDPDKRDALGFAILSMSEIATVLSTDTPGQDIVAMMKPWQSAYEKLRSPS
jgi:hypothetical protein